MPVCVRIRCRYKYLIYCSTSVSKLGVYRQEITQFVQRKGVKEVRNKTRDLTSCFLILDLMNLCALVCEFWYLSLVLCEGLSKTKSNVI